MTLYELSQIFTHDDILLILNCHALSLYGTFKDKPKWLKI
jgi:hypothetical protein